MSATNNLGAKTEPSVGEPSVVSDTVIASEAAANNDTQQVHAHGNLPSLSVPRHPFVDGSRFWAVLIGIDTYEGDALKGCVSDARLMEKFLHEDLHVPRGRIQCLLGSDDSRLSGGCPPPTRDNIIHVLYSLISNTDIDKGDAILIYFAGHGTSYDCGQPSRGGNDCDSGDIFCGSEAICPMDRSNGDIGIPDISDRELNSIFTRISRAKGDNVTVILDCCFSSGATREGSEGVRGAPTLDLPSMQNAFHAADAKMKAKFTTYVSVTSPDWTPDKDSFVTLAACQEYQKARETIEGNSWNGYFTHELIDVLRNHWQKKWTYGHLLEHVSRALSKRGVLDQQPVIAGDSYINKPVWFKSRWSV